MSKNNYDLKQLERTKNIERISETFIINTIRFSLLAGIGVASYQLYSLNKFIRKFGAGTKF